MATVQILMVYLVTFTTFHSRLYSDRFNRRKNIISWWFYCNLYLYHYDDIVYRHYDFVVRDPIGKNILVIE